MSSGNLQDHFSRPSCSRIDAGVDTIIMLETTDLFHVSTALRHR